MTSRERVTAALAHREPDRTPIFEYVLYSPVASDILGRSFDDYTQRSSPWMRTAQREGLGSALLSYVRDRLDLAEVLGHDMLYVCPNPVVDSPAAVESPLGDPVEQVRTRTAHRRATGLGPDPRSLEVYRVLRDEMDRRGLDLPILAPAYEHGVWTDTDLMQTMLLAPRVAHEHFEVATASSLARIRAYQSVGIEQFGIGGDFAGKRPMISPAAYREFIVPQVGSLSRAIHDAGGWAVNASDGDLWSVIEDFLIGCEVDAYLEIDMFAGMDWPGSRRSTAGGSPSTGTWTAGTC